MSSPPVDPPTELVALREQHQAVIDVLRVLGRAGADMQRVLDVVAEAAGRLCGAKVSFLWLAEGDLFHIRAAYGGTEDELAYERAHPHRAEPTTLTGRVARSMEHVRIPDVLADPTYEWEGQRAAGYRALLGVPIIAEGEFVGVLGLSWNEPQVFADDQVRLVTAFADQAAIAIINARLFAAVDRQRAELARFLSPQIADLVSTERGQALLAGHRAYVTVLFSDLRGFTSFAETAEPEELFDVLREYHGEIGSLIAELGGTLEHFAGDGVMVFFNDPEPMPEHESAAVRMAVEVRDRVGVLAAGWVKRGIDLGVGIGVAAGYATLGRIGFEGRFDYAAIGTVTILASRLSSAAAPGQILVSQRLYAAVENLVDATPMDELTLKGYARPVRAWQVFHLREP
ncbi:MAG: adenylate/guanylate cyclase domain-containing protein [Nocardioidaceae bacterium]